jgi:hypothetical protein
MRVGIADHLGWAVVVAASADHTVVDRRRIELVEPGTPVMPVHHDGQALDDEGMAALIDAVRASAEQATTSALDELERSLPAPVVSVALRISPDEFPTDVATLRVPPWDSRADAVMYREVLAEVATRRGWAVHRYDAKTAESQASALLGDRADAVLRGPRARLGSPWAKDHRVALAATIVAG